MSESNVANDNCNGTDHECNGNSHEFTEIRATENPKGGIAYEVILSPPAKKDVVPKRPSSPPKVDLSLDHIQNKLKAAEKRRESLDAEKIGQLADLRSRAEEAAAKRNALVQQFVEEKKENIEKKMMTAMEKREANIQSKIEKLKEHEENILKARRQVEEKLEERQQELGSRIERKLETVAEKREQVIQRKLETLKDHDRRIEEVRNTKLLQATQSSG
ncbi:hypothetical protein CHUAL_005560 [Chamberlinius hualienensis]